jgi:membrane-associated phospholipid phosphatase
MGLQRSIRISFNLPLPLFTNERIDGDYLAKGFQMGWDLKFMRWADEWWGSPILNHAFPWLTYLGSHFAVILFIILSWMITKQRKVLRLLVLLYAIQSAVIYSLKFLIQRQRPFLFLDIASKLSKGPGEILDPSFPSAHAAFSFMMATLLALWFPRYQIIFFIVQVS